MINIIPMLVLVSSLGIQPEMQTNKDPLVEVLPSQTYVLCADKCEKPTPKKKKTVFKRDMQRNENQHKAYSGIGEYLKDKQGPERLKRTAASDGEKKKSRTMAGRTRSVPQESIKKTTTARLAIEKPKVTYNIERIDAPKPAPLVVTYKKLNPEDKTKSDSPGDVEKDKEAVFFDINSSIISEKEKKKLIAWIDSVKSNRYKVLGFSCSTSEESNNMSLSENRAETVRKIIMERRKDAIVTTQGMGRSQSFSQNDQSLNRRANIIALEGEPVKKSVIIVPADTVSNKLEAVKHKVLEEKKTYKEKLSLQ